MIEMKASVTTLGYNIRQSLGSTVAKRHLFSFSMDNHKGVSYMSMNIVSWGIAGNRCRKFQRS